MAQKKKIFSKKDGIYINAEDVKCQVECYIEQQNKYGVNDPTLSQFYGSNMIKEMLKRKNAVGIKFSFVVDDQGTNCLCLMPLDKYGNEIPKDLSALKDDGDSHGGGGPTCPTTCG